MSRYDFKDEDFIYKIYDGDYYYKYMEYYYKNGIKIDKDKFVSIDVEKKYTKIIAAMIEIIYDIELYKYDGDKISYNLGDDTFSFGDSSYSHFDFFKLCLDNKGKLKKRNKARSGFRDPGSFLIKQIWSTSDRYRTVS